MASSSRPEAGTKSAAAASWGAGGEALERALAHGRVSPAYLLEGPDLLVLRAAAQDFAAALLCPEQRLGCACATCARARAGTHPDLVRLRRDKPTVISVEALEPVLAQAHRRPASGARRVFVIEPADALHPDGVGRYLKTLEEPPETTVFLLLTARPERLPETVRSRCRRIGFPPLAEDALAARLVAAGHAAPVARALAAVASGSLERALRLAHDELLARVDEAWTCARATAPENERATERLLALLDAAAQARAAAWDVDEPLEARGDRKREALRAVLQDLLHVVAVEARAAAAGRALASGHALEARAALDLLERCARLSAAVASNVTPGVVVHGLLQALGQALTVR